MNTFIKKSQHGDTIVEVLLAVAVISSMLVGAFSIANKSSSQIRMAQERSEATKLTTTVLELSKKNADLSANKNQWYCYDYNNKKLIKVLGLPAYASVGDVNSAYNSDCLYAPSGGVQFISFVILESPANKFTVNTRWDGVGGAREQQVMMYRGE